MRGLRSRLTGSKQGRFASRGAKRTGSYASNSARVYKRRKLNPVDQVQNRKISALYRMVETKESTQTTAANISLPHNNVYIVQSGGADLNIFKTYNNTDDPMAGVGSRIGDRVTVRGVKLVMFLENALARPKVFYRIMLLRCPRGVAPTRANLFKGDAGNKMIDAVNTERFSIVWQTQFNIQCANGAPNAIVDPLTGVPVQTQTSGGQGTRVVRAWIPGRKFGSGGNIQYENGGVDVKFYDYKLVMLAYDWYGTPQDLNNVGKINELYAKTFFKDA